MRERVFGRGCSLGARQPPATLTTWMLGVLEPSGLA
jgi:hypothetical protein